MNGFSHRTEQPRAYDPTCTGKKNCAMNRYALRKYEQGVTSRWSLYSLGLAVILLSMVGCYTRLTTPKEVVGRSESRVNAPKRAMAGRYQSDDAAPPSESPQAPTKGPADDEPTSSPPSSTRLMIYEGAFGLLVSNVSDAIARLSKDVEQRGGYLQLRESATLTFRVPAEHFRALVEGLGEYGVLLSESIEARDVTREYMDLTLRLSTLEQALARLTKLLDRANSVKEVLEIETEIRRLTVEIERLKGERKYLDSQIAFSTVRVEFRSNARPPRPLRSRTASRFQWINQVGLEQVLERF